MGIRGKHLDDLGYQVRRLEAECPTCNQSAANQDEASMKEQSQCAVKESDQ